MDAAIETATERALEAQEDLAERLIQTGEVGPEARRVEHRAEDLRELAADAATREDVEQAPG